jgi:hypothetical protein
MPRFVSRVAYALVVPAALSIVFGIGYGFLVGLGAASAESVDPSQKARALAEGISEVMNSSAFGFLIAVVAALWLLFCAWTWRRTSAARSKAE